MSGYTMERPTYSEHMGRARRTLVRFWRAASAWDLAHMVADEVTEDDYNRAADLLNRCTRWAIAQMRHDETETAENHDKPARIHAGELLERRMERLNEELRPYGCKIQNLGYFCENVYPYDFENHTVTGSGLLHFYD